MGLDIQFSSEHNRCIEHFRKYHALNRYMGFKTKAQLSRKDILNLLTWVSLQDEDFSIKRDYLSKIMTVLTHMDDYDLEHITYTASW